MLATWFVAGVIACGQADAVAEKPKAEAAAKEQADLKAQVAKLVRELDAPEKARRDAAEKKLL
jgi:hypothetical protein